MEIKHGEMGAQVAVQWKEDGNVVEGILLCQTNVSTQ